MTSMIKVKNLNKVFHIYEKENGFWGGVKSFVRPIRHDVHAVNDIGFEIGQGELVGYLGPNGAGKSTTLKILTGLLVPTSGVVQVNGFTPSKDRKKYVKRIGAVFGQKTTLWWDLPVKESFSLLGKVYDVPDKTLKNNLDELISILDIGDLMIKPVRSLSLGQRMRVELCAALLHKPDILFLDEPTIGLDVIAKEKIRQFIKLIHQRGVTILLTTHDLNDIETLCERVIIIDSGKKVYDGLLRTLVSRYEDFRIVEVVFNQSYQGICCMGEIPVTQNGRQAVFHLPVKEKPIADFMRALYDSYQISDIFVRSPGIDHTISKIYQEKTKG